MKLESLRAKKYLFFLFVGLSFFGFSQQQSSSELIPVTSLLKKASKKYRVVFNYNAQELKDVSSLNQLPKSLFEFKELVSDFAGLEFESFEQQIWIVKKNYSHKIRFLDFENNYETTVSLDSHNKSTNRFGTIFLEIKDYPTILVFKCQNHPNLTLTITENSPKEISLTINPNMLSEVVLNNLYVKGVYLDSNKHVVVKHKYTPLLAGQVQQDAFVSLLNLPQIATNSESISELNIKGGVNDQNLVLWNGIKIFQNAHFFGLISAFNDNLIETMTVIDNATPAQYGNALSGTVKLDFDKNYVKQNTYGIGLNALSGHAFLRQSLTDNSEFSFAIQRSFTDLLQSPTFESYRKKVFQDTDIELSENQNVTDNISREDVFFYQDAQFQLKKKVNDKLNLSLHGIWFENDLNYTEKINDLNNKRSTFNNRNAALGFNADYFWNESNSLTVTYNFSSHKSVGNNDTFTGNLNTAQKNIVDNYFLQAKWSKKRNKTKYSLGADFDGTVVTNRFDNEVTSAFLNLVQIANIYATFADFSLQSDKWRFYAGLRNVYYQRDRQWRFEPRFNLSYLINSNFELSLRGEVKTQNLKQIIDLDQNFLGIEKRRWLLSGQGDSNLQHSNQIEALLKFNKNKFGGYTSIFLRTINGLSSNDQRFQNENQFNNFQTGTAQILGATAHLFYKSENLSSWISYAYLKEEITTPELTFKGNNDLNYRITWGNNFSYKQWNLSFSCIFQDGLHYTSVNQTTPVNTQALEQLNTINFNKPNGEKLATYFRLDTSLQYNYKTLNNQKLTVSLGILNLTDNYNVLRKNYRLSRVNPNQVQEIETLGFNFTPNLGISYLF